MQSSFPSWKIPLPFIVSINFANVLFIFDVFQDIKNAGLLFIISWEISLLLIKKTKDFPFAAEKIIEVFLVILNVSC